MLRFSQILVSTLVLGASAVSLSACGQQGPLYLPTEPAAANRATLPETLLHIRPSKAAPQAPADPASASPSAPASTSVPQ
ncbi:MAG: lipoprotein [Rhodoferax sp.]|uniref:LPS translocon maturation chaperone LptM n=1 Tax=Rhodoferax sp. TaxID=50421 RepID=UPI0027223849|nr:lipoprotein [Rhodoferax sp.]MDO8451075.1 lipoprotein [Rhodoferax sp.]